MDLAFTCLAEAEIDLVLGKEYSYSKRIMYDHSKVF